MELTELFQPLNVFTLTGFGLSFLAFDTIGFFLAGQLQIPLLLRFGHWLLGLGAFVLVWFILHFFISFLPQYVLITLLLLALGTLPYAVIHKSWQSLVREVMTFPWPFVFIALVAKPLFFHLSLPPRFWDEMAYHYYSPSQLLYEQTWQYEDLFRTNVLYLFSMTPRFLDTAYVLMFALTKTYATARLLHFTLFFTSVFVVGRLLQKQFGRISAIVFAFLTLFLNLTLLTGSTTGYTDTGAASLLMISFASFVGYLVTHDKGYGRSAIIFAALSAGTKYTSGPFIAASCIAVGCIELILHREQVMAIFRSNARRLQTVWPYFRETLVLSGLGFAFGGYWYVKNFIISGNPIFPFFFACWEGIPHCGEGSSFFANWSIPFTLQTAPEIIASVFQGKPLLYWLIGLSLVVVLALSRLSNYRHLGKVAGALVLTVLLEISLSHRFVGYELRYFSHWLYLIPFIYALPFAGWPQLQSFFTYPAHKKFPAIGLGGVLIALVLVTIPLSTDALKAYNKLEGINDNDRWFARGKLPFLEWVHPSMPHMYPVITWCGEKRAQPIDLYTADPKLIFWTEGLMKIFLVNCRLHYIKDIFMTPQEHMPAAVDQFLRDHPGVLVVSALTCEESRTARQTAHYIKTDPFMSRYIVLNEALICRGTEIQPRVYTFTATQ